MQPAQRRSSTPALPVVYAVDANSNFGALHDISLALQSEGGVTPFILVGIGYPSEHPKAGLALRARDLTFPGYPELSTEIWDTDGVLNAEKGTKRFLGAPDFLKFLEHELFPSIARTYRTKSGDRTFFGHSVGGGFALYALLAKPHLFQRYIVSSPGLTYNGVSSAGVTYHHYTFMQQAIDRLLADHPGFDGLRVYLSVGSEEEFQAAYKNWELTSSFYRIAARLRTLMGAQQLIAEVLPGETHMSAWPIAFMHGIRELLKTESTPGNRS